MDASIVSGRVRVLLRIVFLRVINVSPAKCCFQYKRYIIINYTGVLKNRQTTLWRSAPTEIVRRCIMRGCI